VANDDFIDAPENFPKVEGVSFKVETQLPWHLISSEEKNTYELYEYSEAIYVAGNSSGVDKSASNLAIVVTQPGALTFDFSLAAYEGTANSFDYLGYSIGTPITKDISASNCAVIAQGDKQPVDGAWESVTITVDESAFENQSEVTIYIAYVHSKYYSDDTHLNYAAIRNVTYSTGARDDVVLFEQGSENMGIVMAEKQVVTVTTVEGKEVTTITYEPADINALTKGNTYRIKAVAKPGYQFYGWVRHYTSATNNRNYTSYEPYDADGMLVTVDETTYYTPVFATQGAYYIRKNTDFYGTDTSIAEVLENATGEVVLLKDYTIPSDITELTVPASVRFYVPFRSQWGKAESEGSYHMNIGGTGHISGMEKAYATLTIPETTTVTFNGDLILGAERNSAGQDGFQGHISGSFGHIENHGHIVLNNKVVLTCFGLITGTGTLLAKDGSEVKESLVISDFSGGNNSLQLYTQDQMPFVRYSAQNVQCTLQMEAKSRLSAMAVLFALGGHNEVDVKLFGSGDDVVFNTKVTTDNTVILERTYDSSKQIESGSGNNTTGVGVSNWHISGGLKLQTLTISLANVISLDTARAVFPLPYNMHLELSDGDYDIDKGIAVMPGSKVTVHQGATLNLTGKLYVMDGLVQGNMSGDKYPTRADLVNAGFAGYGEFILNGTLNVRAGATLGGVIQSTQAGAVLNVEDGAYLDNRTDDLTKLDPIKTKLILQSTNLFDQWAIVVKNEADVVTAVRNWVVQFGGYGHYDDNTVWMNIPARIWDGTALTQLVPGLYVSGVSENVTVSDSYSGVYVPEIASGTEKGGLTYNTADGNRYMVNGTEAFDRTISGVWATPSDELEIVVNDGKGSSKADSLTNGIKLETVYVTNEDDSLTLNITPMKGGEKSTTKFVYLITCLMSDGTTQTVGVKHDGVATLPAGTISITIDWTALGDITGDGYVKANDYKKLKDYVTKKITEENIGEMGKLAGDITGDGSVKANDYKKLKDYVTKKISQI
jgi:hypothetical protein